MLNESVCPYDRTEVSNGNVIKCEEKTLNGEYCIIHMRWGKHMRCNERSILSKDGKCRENVWKNGLCFVHYVKLNKE